MAPIVEKDFIERMIKQFAEALARALGLARKGKVHEAIEQLEAACPSLLGMDYAPLALVDSASAAALLREPAKVKTFAKLLAGAAEVYELAGEPGLARSKWQHALEVFLEASRLRPDDAEAAEQIRLLAAKVPLDLLPEKYRAQVQDRGVRG